MQKTDFNSREVLSQNLNYYVERSGKSQSELAEACGVAQSTFNEWCRGKKYPRIDKIERLADIFGIKIGDLIAPREWETISSVKRESIELVMLSSDEDAEHLLQIIKLYLRK